MRGGQSVFLSAARWIFTTLFRGRSSPHLLGPIHMPNFLSRFIQHHQPTLSSLLRHPNVQSSLTLMSVRPAFQSLSWSLRASLGRDMGDISLSTMNRGGDLRIVNLFVDNEMEKNLWNEPNYVGIAFSSSHLDGKTHPSSTKYTGAKVVEAKRSGPLQTTFHNARGKDIKWSFFSPHLITQSECRSYTYFFPSLCSAVVS